MPVIIAGAAGGVLLLGLILYFAISGDSAQDAREADFQWLERRQAELRDIGVKLTEYAKSHGNQFPRDAAALAKAGILTPEQARFRDPSRAVEVQRQYRPGAIPREHGYRIIIMLENYDPNPAEDVLALYSDGEVGLRMGLESTLRDDNGQRKYLKMPEIPWAAP